MHIYKYVHLFTHAYFDLLLKHIHSYIYICIYIIDAYLISWKAFEVRISNDMTTD